LTLLRLQLESKLEDDCVKLAIEDYEVDSLKMDLAKRSWPDRLFETPDHPWFVEFKRKGEGPRVQQAARLDKLRARGYRVSVIDDIDTFERELSLFCLCPDLR